MQNNTPIPLDIGHNQTGANNRVQLAKTLTLVQVNVIGIAYIQPMTIFDTFEWYQIKPVDMFQLHTLLHLLRYCLLL